MTTDISLGQLNQLVQYPLESTFKFELYQEHLMEEKILSREELFRQKIKYYKPKRNHYSQIKIVMSLISCEKDLNLS